MHSVNELDLNWIISIHSDVRRRETAHRLPNSINQRRLGLPGALLHYLY